MKPIGLYALKNRMRIIRAVILPTVSPYNNKSALQILGQNEVSFTRYGFPEIFHYLRTIRDVHVFLGIHMSRSEHSSY